MEKMASIPFHIKKYLSKFAVHSCCRVTGDSIIQKRLNSSTPYHSVDAHAEFLDLCFPSGRIESLW